MYINPESPEARRIGRKIAEILAEERVSYHMIEAAMCAAKDFLNIGGVADNAPDAER